MYFFIINPMSRSGQGLSVWNSLKQVLDTRHVEYSYYITSHRGHGTKFAKNICAENDSPFIVVVGGDGTMNEIINGISDYDKVTLGYIPSGSGNDLARGLGIPRNPIDALNCILNTQKLVKVDTGYLKLLDNSSAPIKKFCTSTGIGMDASICHTVYNSKLKYVLNKIHLGKLVYLLITIRQLFTCRFTDAEITIDGVKKKYKNLAFCASLIQKSEGGGLCMAPDASYTDQKLSICMVYGLSRPRLMMLLPTIFFGKHSSFDGIDVFDCSTITIKTKKKLILHVDGEYAGHSSYISVQCFPTQISMPYIPGMEI